VGLIILQILIRLFKNAKEPHLPIIGKIFQELKEFFRRKYMYFHAVVE